MPRFEYPCPDCRTTNSLHDAGCEFEGTPWDDVERAYVDVVAVLSAGTVAEDDLPAAVPGEWDALHRAAVAQLRHDGRVTEANGVLRLRTAEEYTEAVAEPTHDPMRTVYRHGSVPGCHDNAVFAMIAWYEMVGLSWEETRDRVVEWLHDTGAWSRGGFEESSPEALVEQKRHVYEAGYGWKDKAEAAKRVIDRHR